MGDCRNCTGALDFEFTMAFQPIVDVDARRIYAHEALCRTPDGGSAGRVLGQVTPGNRHSFDQRARVKAIELAARLGATERVSINFLPSAVLRPENCLQTSIAACEETGFPIEQVVFEMVESDAFNQPGRLNDIVSTYTQMGFGTAIDDFGTGFSSLAMLADFPPDFLKIDMSLIRDIDSKPRRRTIVGHLMALTRDLRIRVIAEGIETEAEYRVLRDLGVELFQGFLFAKPRFESLHTIEDITIPEPAGV